MWSDEFHRQTDRETSNFPRRRSILGGIYDFTCVRIVSWINTNLSDHKGIEKTEFHRNSQIFTLDVFNNDQLATYPRIPGRVALFLKINATAICLKIYDWTHYRLPFWVKDNKQCAEICLEALQKFEYRGYDLFVDNLVFCEDIASRYFHKSFFLRKK